MGITERYSPSEVMRAIEALPERTKRRAGLAVGGGASLTAVLSLLGNVYQMHLSDQKGIRSLAAEEREEAACEARVHRCYTEICGPLRAEHDRHMREAHGL